MLKSILEFFTGVPRPPSTAPVAVPGDATPTFNLEPPPVDPVVALRGLSANGSWVEMEKHGRALLDVQLNDLEVLELLAYSLQQQGQYRDAIELCQRVYAVAPERWMTNFVAGVSFKALGMPQDACVWLSRAADIAPDDPQTARLLAESRLDVERPLDPLLALRSLSAESRWAELEKQGLELLELRPAEVEGLELVAYSLQQQGQYQRAVELCERAYAIAPDRWMTNFVAGVSCKALGRAQDACVWLLRAASLAPNDPQTARLLLESQIEADGADASVEAYRLHRQRLGYQGVVVVAPVQNVRDWALVQGLHFLVVGEQQETMYEAPHVWGQSGDPARETVVNNLPYVVEIPDARIFSRSSLILTSDNTVLSDVAGHPEFGKFVGLSYEDVVLSQKDGKVVLDFEAYETQEIAAGIWMSGLASNAFGHWLPEFLPKLQFLQQHPDFSSLPIIIDDDMPASHIEHLRRLVENPLLVLPAKTSFLCRRLLVAPTPTFSPVELLPNNIPAHQVGALSLRALDFLRQGVTAGCSQPGQRFFLGRKGMRWRRLLNEEEISTDLSSLGFSTVYMEDMTASEQITLFQTAEWIVAPNGSALLNLIFADTNIRLLVLSQSNLFNWGNFQGPMNTLGYSPVFLCGEEADAVDQKHADYVVPLTSIRRALADMGLDEAAA